MVAQVRFSLAEARCLSTRCLLVLGVVTRSGCCWLFDRAAGWQLESSMEPLPVLVGQGGSTRYAGWLPLSDSELILMK